MFFRPWRTSWNAVIIWEFTRTEKECNICRRVKNAQMNLDWCDTYCYEVDHLTSLATHKVTASYKLILPSNIAAEKCGICMCCSVGLTPICWITKHHRTKLTQRDIIVCSKFIRVGFICNILPVVQLQRSWCSGSQISWVLFVCTEFFIRHFGFGFAKMKHNMTLCNVTCVME